MISVSQDKAELFKEIRSKFNDEEMRDLFKMAVFLAKNTKVIEADKEQSVSLQKQTNVEKFAQKRNAAPQNKVSRPLSFGRRAVSFVERYSNSNSAPERNNNPKRSSDLTR